MTTPLSLVARKARLQALRDLIDVGGGAMQFYTGTSEPATPETPSPDSLLGTVALATVSGSIGNSGNIATYTLSVPRVSTANATGVVGWVRVIDGAGDGVLDCSVVEFPAVGPVVLSDTQVYAGGEIQLISCVFTE